MFVMPYNNQEPQTHLGLNARKINEGQREDYPGKVMRENIQLGIAVDNDLRGSFHMLWYRKQIVYDRQGQRGDSAIEYGTSKINMRILSQILGPDYVLGTSCSAFSTDYTGYSGASCLTARNS